MDLDDEPTDEELVAAAQAGDDAAFEALVVRHHRLVRARATPYFVAGGDREDIVQEGMIGLFKAVRDFEPGMGAGFRAFAEVCVSRQVLTAVRTAQRHKHGPLNDYVSIHGPLTVDEHGDYTLADVLPAPPQTDPASQVLFSERVRDLKDHVRSVMSDLEVEVLRLHLDGRNYREIAATLKRRAKSVDNALQRIKRKIHAHAVEWDAAVA